MRDFADLLEALGLLGGQLVELLELIEDFQRLARLGFEIRFSKLFLIELHDAADRANVVAKLRGGREQIFNDDGRARDRFQQEKLRALDALGDDHFALASEQRHGTHLAQIEADGILGFFRGARAEIEFAVAGESIFFGLGVGDVEIVAVAIATRGFGGEGVFEQANTVALEGREHGVDLFRGMDFRRKEIVYFVIEQVTALFAQIDESANLLVFFFNQLRQGSLRSVPS